MTCKLCQTEKQNWSGDAPKCGFEDGEFSNTNWNCFTVNKIREMCEDAETGKADGGIHYQYCEDQKYCAINIDGLDDVDGMCLWVSWYKNRGRTEAMWIMDYEGKPRKPNEEEVLAIAGFYGYNT